MDRKQVTPGKSSQIVSIGYDEANKILELEFTSGGVYRYFEFPRELYEEFIRAESLGVFVAQRIRGAFEFSRMHIEECRQSEECEEGCGCFCHRLTKSSREEKQNATSKTQRAPSKKKARPVI